MLIDFSGSLDAQSQSGYITIPDLFDIRRENRDRQHVPHRR